jgi:hypothetical protein
MKIKKEVKHILSLDNLGPYEKSNLLDCEIVDLSDVLFAAITVRYTTPINATENLIVRVFSGIDTMIFDTDEYVAFAPNKYPGKEAQATFEVSQVTALPFKYLRVIVENTDPNYSYTDIDVWVTLVRFE